MERNGWSRRHVVQGLVACAASATVLGGRRVWAANPVQVISHRYPALEFWVNKMKSAIPGVAVNTQLIPFDKMMELVNISMSAKADTLDIVYAIDTTVMTYAKNGWLRPLDDLWAKYKAEFKLGDYAEPALKSLSYKGRLYAIPGTINVMMYYYRKDLFDQAGKQPPKTIAEYQALAKFFNTPARAGTISCLKPVDAVLNEAHYYLNTVGAGWFDDKWRPILNNARGVKAIETLKEMTRSAQRGFTTAANDECTIALQQDAAVMGMQWATRARTMDDPKQSRVTGKIDWTAMPEGHARLLADGYGISAFSKQDPDLLFRIIATATNEANMREASALLVPPRRSILADPELREKNRFYPAATAAVNSGLPYPELPEFYLAGDFIARRILQAVTGEMGVKQALDTAAAETETFLKARGYY